MKSNVIGEVGVATILILLLFVFLNPTNILMPPPFVTMLICLLLVVFVIYAAIFWKEKSKDERENLHKYIVGRFAFLIGSSVLVMGIVLQEFQHNLDPWLVYALSSMILAKAIGSIYAKMRL